MTNNLKEDGKSLKQKLYDMFDTYAEMDEYGGSELIWTGAYWIENGVELIDELSTLINQKEKELLEKFEEMLEDQTYPKLPTTAEAEDRMWRGKERNQLRKELRDRIKQLKEELKGGQDE